MNASPARQAAPESVRSIYSQVTYNQSAVNDMNMGELDILLQKNEKRILEIKERFAISQT